MLEEFLLRISQMVRLLSELVCPFRENFFRCLVKETNLAVCVPVFRLGIARLQIVRNFLKNAKRVSDIFCSLGCNTQVLCKLANLLVQVDVAFLGLSRDTAHSLVQLVSNLIHLLDAESNFTIWCDKLLNRANLLLFEHGRLLCLVLAVVNLGKEAHKELIATKDAIAQHMHKKTRQDTGSLRHVLLLVELGALEGLCSGNDHIRVGLYQVVLQQVEILILAPNIRR